MEAVNRLWSQSRGTNSPGKACASICKLRIHFLQAGVGSGIALQFHLRAPLTDETSTQFTLGIAAQPMDALTITLDYSFIALDDRIWRSSPLNISPEEAAQLIALGVPGAETLTRLLFFTNDMDTETSGIDLVASYNIDSGGGNTTISLAANVNESKVTRRTDRQTDPANPNPVYFLSDADLFRIENSDPEFRVNLTGRHNWANDVTVTLLAMTLVLLSATSIQDASANAGMACRNFMYIDA